MHVVVHGKRFPEITRKSWRNVSSLLILARWSWTNDTGVIKIRSSILNIVWSVAFQRTKQINPLVCLTPKQIIKNNHRLKGLPFWFWYNIVFRMDLMLSSPFATGSTPACGWRFKHAEHITVHICSNEEIFLQDFLVIPKRFWSAKDAFYCVTRSESHIRYAMRCVYIPVTMHVVPRKQLFNVSCVLPVISTIVSKYHHECYYNTCPCVHD